MTFLTKLVFSSFAFIVSINIHAQNQTAIVGQATQLKFNISNVVNSKKCHIEVTLPDQTKTSVEVDGPQFVAVVDFIPQKIGNMVIQWEGKNKIRGVNSVFACPGSGVVQLQVNGNAEQISQRWNQYFSQINDEVKDCVKYGMDLSQFKYQVLADPNTVLTSPDDQKLKPIYEKCENFAKQNHPRKAYSCVLPQENNAKSTCYEVYSEKLSDGKLKTITRADAIQLHFDGKPWVIGQIENPDARLSRLKLDEENKIKQSNEQAAKLKQEEENKLKQAAEQAAKLEAEEKDRKFKESPEYKKQQAVIERKRIVEEKEAAKSAAEAERKRIIEEKQAEKIAAELERKRIADEKVATDRQEKEAQIEKERIAEAQRIRNQPLSKATLNSKLEYKYFNDGRCTEDRGQRCLDINQYKQICDLSNGFTINVRSILGVYYSGEYSEFLARGGTLANTKYGWNGKTCVISFNVTGTFRGTSHNKQFIGVITSFIVTDSKEVLIHSALFQ